ncbi:MAG TPA: hypothetical protein VMU93_12165 [Caulobacteraceae bacterium]|nr:hypothetical protein [Caulobacteraceae bacterium]
MQFGSHPGASPLSYLVPLAAVLLIVVLRNSRPRKLRIERLWLYPAIYLVLMAGALAAAPPPLTPINLGALVLGFAIGAGLGWQRGRLTHIHIHPETHDLTSRASPIGLFFIFAIVALRYALRGVLTQPIAGVPVIAATDALLVMAVAMLSTQRLELWLRARKLLAEAQSGAQAPPKLVG